MGKDRGVTGAINHTPSPFFCLFPLMHYEGLKDLPMPCMVVTFLGSLPEMKLRELEYFILFIFGFLLYLS